jgi:synaptobrevin family protein YKT6
MPQLFAIAILNHKGPETSPTLISTDYELSSFGFFKRGTVQELVTFFIRQVVQRTRPGEKNVIDEGDYVCHAYVSVENLAAAVVTDKSYPTRVALSLCALALSEFRTANGDKWRNFSTDTQMVTPSIKDLLAKYQKPDEADNISRIQKELEEVKEILHHSMEDLLNRGEKLDSIIERSEDLSASSKQFLWQAKKTNQCCSYY